MTPVGTVRPGNVPTARVGPIMAELIADRWPERQCPNGEEWRISILAEKIGCHYDSIDNITRQVHPGAGFDLVDRLFCALGRPDVWWGILADIYPTTFWETCALSSCGKRFPESRRSGKRKRFCSDNCRSLYWKTQTGEATGLRMVQRGKCFKGHKMTPENTLRNRQPDGSYKKQCRKCKLESMAAYKRKQRREQRDEINRKQREYRARRKLAMA